MSGKSCCARGDTKAAAAAAAFSSSSSPASLLLLLPALLFLRNLYRLAMAAWYGLDVSHIMMAKMASDATAAATLNRNTRSIQGEVEEGGDTGSGSPAASANGCDNVAWKAKRHTSARQLKRS